MAGEDFLNDFLQSQSVVDNGDITVKESLLLRTVQTVSRNKHINKSILLLLLLMSLLFLLSLLLLLGLTDRSQRNFQKRKA